MDSLLEPDANARVVTRLRSLSADARPHWGKLTCVQMLVHCQRPFLVASGELRIKRNLLGRLIGGLARKKFVESPAPFKRNLPTDPGFLAPEAQGFDRQKAVLIELAQRFAEPGTDLIDVHPFFGSMTPENWDQLLSKHLDHHLRQFGV